LTTSLYYQTFRKFILVFSRDSTLQTRTQYNATIMYEDGVEITAKIMRRNTWAHSNVKKSTNETVS